MMSLKFIGYIGYQEGGGVIMMSAEALQIDLV